MSEFKDGGSRLRILKAAHGDAFILEVKQNSECFVMVIDGGPRSAYRFVKPELIQLVERGKIDLMVLTHFDHDHIYGLLEFLKNNEDNLGVIEKLWLNLPERIKVPDDSSDLTYEEAKNLRDVMEEVEEKTENPIDWRERLIIEDKEIDNKDRKPIYCNEFVRIWLLAPSESDIRRNEIIFRRKVKEDQDARNLTGDNEEDALKPLDEIWEEEYGSGSTTPINDASIALLIESYDGKVYLMGGDANPATIERSLRVMGYDESNPIRVNVFKLPHHGSRSSILNTLLDIVDADCYLISTNGGSGRTKHPNRETIAKLLLHKNRNSEKTCRICFNYNLDGIRKHSGQVITDEEIEENKYNFIIEGDVETL